MQQQPGYGTIFRLLKWQQSNPEECGLMYSMMLLHYSAKVGPSSDIPVEDVVSQAATVDGEFFINVSFPILVGLLTNAKTFQLFSAVKLELSTRYFSEDLFNYMFWKHNAYFFKCQ